MVGTFIVKMWLSYISGNIWRLKVWILRIDDYIGKNTVEHYPYSKTSQHYPTNLDFPVWKMVPTCN